jgi:hypothetical protein
VVDLFTVGLWSLLVVLGGLWLVGGWRLVG